MTIQNQHKKNNALSPKNIIQLILNNWYWFLISVVFFTGIGAFYVAKKQPLYLRTAQILIKDQETGGVKGPDFGELSGLDLLNQSSNIWNELGVIQSPDMMLQVVNLLDLNRNYTQIRLLRNRDLYGDSIPVDIKLNQPNDEVGVSFYVRFGEDGTYQISKIKEAGKRVKGKYEGTFGQELETPVGGITITKTAAFDNFKLPFTLRFAYQSPYSAALSYSKRLQTAVRDKKASIIELSFTDASRKRADDILASIIDVYNLDWVSDKKLIAHNTALFINERLASLEGELGSADSDISSFKSSNLIPDLDVTSKIALDQAARANNDIMEVKGQIQMTKYIQDQVKKINTKQTLPTNTGVDNPALVAQINTYNTTVMQRNSLASVSGETNPVVRDLDANLANLKTSIAEGIDNQLIALQTQLAALDKYAKDAQAKIASNPQQAQQLLSIERQQKVKESLYLYLLQKREENELSTTYTISNAKIIKAPNGEASPAAPRSKVILAGAFLFGLFFPLGILLLREQMSTTVRSREEFDQLVSLPVAGEIPLKDEQKYFATIRNVLNKYIFHRGKASDEAIVAVGKGGRNIINEAFRILRTNLRMMDGGVENCRVFAVTSMNPGSGKSFISMNLAITYALKGRRVAVVDCDLRHGSLSKYVNSPRVGLTDYLIGSATPDKIEVKYPDIPNLTVVPYGITPPNPTELLENGKLETLLTDLRSQYDVVILDCPPVGIVADTDIVNLLADRTLFVVRMGLFERDSVPELERIYKDKRLKNPAIILNGVHFDKSQFYYGKSAYYYYVGQ